MNEYEQEVEGTSAFFSYSAARCSSAQASGPSVEGGVGRIQGGDRGEDSRAIQTSGACSAARSRHCDQGCIGRGCREQEQVNAAMVKISFQPAVAGIKAEKADKAAASGPASASAPAAEILLTPARVRGTGSQMGGGAGWGRSSRDLGIPQWPRRPEVPRSRERKRDERSEMAAPSSSGKGSRVLPHSGSRKQRWSLSGNAHRVPSKCGGF